MNIQIEIYRLARCQPSKIAYSDNMIELMKYSLEWAMDLEMHGLALIALPVSLNWIARLDS